MAFPESSACAPSSLTLVIVQSGRRWHTAAVALSERDILVAWDSDFIAANDKIEGRKPGRVLSWRDPRL